VRPPPAPQPLPRNELARAHGKEGMRWPELEPLRCRGSGPRIRRREAGSGVDLMVGGISCNERPVVETGHKTTTGGEKPHPLATTTSPYVALPHLAGHRSSSLCATTAPCPATAPHCQRRASRGGRGGEEEEGLAQLESET
jgi:hypothetical protein